MGNKSGINTLTLSTSNIRMELKTFAMPYITGKRKWAVSTLYLFVGVSFCMNKKKMLILKREINVSNPQKGLPEILQVLEVV